MAGEHEVNVKFGATIDEFKSKMGEVSGIFKEVTEKFALFAAAAAGGAAFAEFINSANKMNSEAEKMSRTLGITGEEAGAIAVAINDVGSELGIAGASADTYTGAFLKFNRSLRTNSAAMKDLGVDVDALKNGQKTSNQVFQEAVEIVGKYKPGVDQTQIAMQLFGRSVQDVQLLMGVTAEKMEEARKKQRELNLVITEEGVEAAKKYRMSMNDVHDVLEGLEKTIGEAMMPVFTESANRLAAIGPALVEGMQAAVGVFVEIWNTMRETVMLAVNAIIDMVKAVGAGLAAVFGSSGEGPSAMQVFRNVLGMVQAAVITFRILFEEFVNAIKTGLAVLVSALAGFGAVADRVFHLDFSGARAVWKDAIDERIRIVKEGVDRAIEIAVKGKEDLDKALVTTPLAERQTGTAKGGPAGAGTLSADIGKIKKTPDTAAKEAAAAQALLKAQLAADNALQKEYTAEAQKIYDEAYKTGEISAQQFYDAKLAIAMVGIDQEMSAKQKELEGTKALEAAAGTPEQKLKFQAQEAMLQGAINVLLEKRTAAIRENAAAAADAQKALAAEQASFQSTQTKDSGDGRVAAEQATLAQMKALRQVSAQDAFQIEKQLEDDSYSILLQSLADKAAAIKGNELEQQKQRDALQLQSEAAARAHEAKLTQISNSAEMDRQKYSLQAQQSIQTSFSSMVNGLLAGVTKVSDVFRNFGISVANTFTNLIAQKFTDRLFDVTGANKLMDQMVGFVTDGLAKIVAKWGLSETTKTAAATSGAAARTALSAGEQAATQVGTLTTAAIVETAQVVQTSATVAGAATRTGVEVAASATSKTLTIGDAIASIGAKAWQAAASVYAAIAAIPYVGPFLAPVMAVAAGAAVLGFAANIASSEGGEYQVDQDRLNFVHKNETILPAPFAQGLRQLVGDGGVTPVLEAVEQIQRGMQPGAGQAPNGKPSAGATPTAMPRNNLPTALPSSVGAASRLNTSLTAPAAGMNGGAGMGRSGDTFHFNLSAIDGPSAKQFIMDNGKHVATALQAQARNFRPTTT